MFEAVAHVGVGLQVEDGVAVLQGVAQPLAVEHVARNHLALRVGANAGDVLATAGGEVVVDHHGDAVGEQAVGQVGADEAGPARDQGASHRAVPNRLSPPLW